MIKMATITNIADRTIDTLNELDKIISELIKESYKPKYDINPLTFNDNEIFQEMRDSLSSLRSNFREIREKNFSYHYELSGL